MILDTYMYMDYREAREGVTISEVLKELENHPDYGEGGIHHGEYTVLSKVAGNPQIGGLTVCCQSADMGYDSGTAACTFKSPDGNGYYVAFRGTGDGEWPDNGIGMTSPATTQQNRALSYFEEVVEALEIGGQDHLVVTGHSKGGNKAQFVTMETRYDALVDVCYSVDGQGFSQSAIERWKERYGEQEYEERRKKLYGIHGENDYVSVLGNSIIPGEHIRYVRTPVEKGNFAGYHDIKYMFATLVRDQTTGICVTSFHGRKNSDVQGQGELGRYAAALSSDVMELPVWQRDGCAAVIMQLMEALGGERKTGLNGEKVTLMDLRDFAVQGIPLIAASIFRQEEGRALLGALLKKETFTGELPAGIVLRADCGRIQELAGETEELAAGLERLTGEIRKTAEEIPLYMKGYTALYHNIRLSARELEKNRKILSEIARFRKTAVRRYRKWEEQG